MSIDELRRAGGARDRVIAHSLAFIFGFSTVFVAMGASFSVVGQVLFDHRDAIRYVGGALMTVFGLYVAGVLPLAWLGRYRRIELRTRPAGLAGSWGVGVTFAAGWTPCVGPILGSILSLASTADTVGSGVALLCAYSLGMALPFFLSSIALDRFLTAFRRIRPWIPVVERAAGLMLVLVGILVLTNQFVVLNSYAIRVTPEWLLRRL
jgi:cytochrome c-type biogenesis protein